MDGPWANGTPAARVKHASCCKGRESQRARPCCRCAPRARRAAAASCAPPRAAARHRAAWPAGHSCLRPAASRAPHAPRVAGGTGRCWRPASAHGRGMAHMARIALSQVHQGHLHSLAHAALDSRHRAVGGSWTLGTRHGMPPGRRCAPAASPGVSSAQLRHPPWHTQPPGHRSAPPGGGTCAAAAPRGQGVRQSQSSAQRAPHAATCACPAGARCPRVSRLVAARRRACLGDWPQVKDQGALLPAGCHPVVCICCAPLQAARQLTFSCISSRSSRRASGAASSRRCSARRSPTAPSRSASASRSRSLASPAAAAATCTAVWASSSRGVAAAAAAWASPASLPRAGSSRQALEPAAAAVLQSPLALVPRALLGLAPLACWPLPATGAPSAPGPKAAASTCARWSSAASSALNASNCSACEWRGAACHGVTLDGSGRRHATATSPPTPGHLPQPRPLHACCPPWPALPPEAHLPCTRSAARLGETRKQAPHALIQGVGGGAQCRSCWRRCSRRRPSRSRRGRSAHARLGGGCGRLSLSCGHRRDSDGGSGTLFVELTCLLRGRRLQLLALCSQAGRVCLLRGKRRLLLCSQPLLLQHFALAALGSRAKLVLQGCQAGRLGLLRPQPRLLLFLRALLFCDASPHGGGVCFGLRCCSMRRLGASRRLFQLAHQVGVGSSQLQILLLLQGQPHATGNGGGELPTTTCSEGTMP